MIDPRQELALEQELFDLINKNIKQLEEEIKRDQMDAIADVGHCYLGAFDDAPEKQDKLELLKANAKIQADKIAELKKRMAANFPD